jgi:SWIRM-associated region 1
MNSMSRPMTKWTKTWMTRMAHQPISLGPLHASLKACLLIPVRRNQTQRSKGPADLALKASAEAAKLEALADAEDAQIRSSLASLIKLTLIKLMSQFEELEDILEEVRRGLESAKMALLNEWLRGVRLQEMGAWFRM